jgi:septal ring factor EnvC (AmiA/AmiB activator)
MTDTNFVNLYIERLVAEVCELTKIKLMNETQILFIEKQSIELSNQVNTLAAQIHSLNAEVETLKQQLEQANRVEVVVADVNIEPENYNTYVPKDKEDTF